MTIDEIITGLVYIVGVFIVFFIGKLVYDKSNPSFDLKIELVEKDNLALSLDIIGYYFGLIMAIGGILSGPSNGWIDDLIDIGIYGIMAIILLNLSIRINNKFMMTRFDNIKEIITDQNAGMGAVQAGNHIANGLILYGALSGEGGGLVSALVFWLIGQLVLILVARIYDVITPYSLHKELEKDNVAVGAAFAGVLIAIGNVIREGLAGDFYSWQENLSTFAGFVIFGVVLIPILRILTDKILLPGRKLTDELVNQVKPNVGAGMIEAFTYIIVSFLLGWVV